jgi:hypothetical protein
MIAKLAEDSQRDLLRGIDWFERIRRVLAIDSNQNSIRL